MGDAQLILAALVPVILLLALGVVAAVGSRAIGLSSIVGYIGLGIALRLAGLGPLFTGGTVTILGSLGVVFLLFEIGLHFPLAHLKSQAGNLFGIGPLQVVAAAVPLAVIADAFGLSPVASTLVGVTLALSSTAVVARLIAERHQQSCPVGLTATSILIFQDIAAIFVLIFAGALGHHVALLPAMATALVKAAAAFGVALLLGRFLVRPLFALIARSRNEEVFTAVALLVALAAGWATGAIGLSLTLGAFLGGMIIAETPYRAVIESEIRPFRGLFSGFFFILVGLTLDMTAILDGWPAILGLALTLVAVKIASNIGASLAFRWSIPGSTQLGFLLAQGSEFAFVIFSLASVRTLIGTRQSAILIAAVAISLAATPTIAEFGRSLAGRLRARKAVVAHPELQPLTPIEPVFIAGMGRVGRMLADALSAFAIPYAAIERDERRLREAVADGYNVSFGDFADPRIWSALALHGRKISVLTAPVIEVSRTLCGSMHETYPALTRIAIVDTEEEAVMFRAIGMLAVLNRSSPAGADVAELVLQQLGVDQARFETWRLQELAKTSLMAGVV